MRRENGVSVGEWIRVEHTPETTPKKKQRTVNERNDLFDWYKSSRFWRVVDSWEGKIGQ